MQYKMLFLLYVTMSSILVGCGQPETKSVNSVDSESPTSQLIEMAGDTSKEGFKPVENAVELPLPADYKPGQPIVFIDSSTFDSDLSAILTYGVDNLEVETGFSLNSIPTRMERWFSEIKNSGGKVQAKNIVITDNSARNILGLAFDLAFLVIGKVQDATTYRPAQSYNVMLYYDDAKMVQKVVFTRRVTT